MEAKKYELTNEKLLYKGHTLYRIKACKSFPTSIGVAVNAGDLGGWVENISNLSQQGDAWIFDDAKVYGDAEIWGNAVIFGDAEIWDNAQIYGFAHILDNAKIYGNAHIFGDAEIHGDAIVCGKCKVCDCADIKTQWDICCIDDSVGVPITFFKTEVGSIISVMYDKYYDDVETLKVSVDKMFTDTAYKQSVHRAIADAKRHFGVD